MRRLHGEPVAWVFAFYLAGILLAAVVHPGARTLLLLITGIFLIAFLPPCRSLIPLFVGVIFFLLGGLGYTLSLHRLPPDALVFGISPEKTVTVTGVIRSFPEISAKRTRFLLEAERCAGREAAGRIQVTLVDAHKGHSGSSLRLRLRYGDRICLRGRFLPPRNYGNPGAFDYAGYLARKGVRLTAATTANHVGILKRNRGNPLVAGVLAQKRAFHDFIGKILNGEVGSLLPALIVGDRSGLGENLRRRFADAGAAHLLAISGLHVGFAVLFFYTLLLLFFRLLLPLRLLRQSRFWCIPSRLASIGSLIFLVYYVILSGGRTATIRAAIMIGVFLLSRILERSRDLLHTLLIAAFVILLWSPASCFAVDFQLSFAAVTAMVLYDRSRKERAVPATKDEGIPDDRLALKPAPEGRRAWKWIAKGGAVFAVTLLAFTATLPITAAVFHRVSPAGLVSNLLLVPLTGLVIVPCGMATFFVFILSPSLAVYPAKITAFGISGLFAGVDFFGRGPLRPVWVVPPPALWIVLFYLILLVLLVLPRISQGCRLASVFLLSALFAGAVLGSGTDKGDGRLHIDILDVGNAASTLAILPDGKTLLIDGGGSYTSSWDVGRRLILPALLTLGVRKIDLMILTHPHPDHLNGLVGILEELPVGAVWEGWRTFPSEMYRRFRKDIDERGISRRYVGAGEMTCSLGNTILKIFRAKGPSGKNDHGAVNNGSLIVKIRLGRFSFLDMADLEAKGEKILIRRYRSELKATVLEVGHHGSRTSSRTNFLDAVRPEAAVISVGAYNRFGHPAAEVLGRLCYMTPKKTIYRTDREGMIRITTDGERFAVASFRQGFTLDSQYGSVR
ncbi:MAG: DNA internalization-related competence protein ComEC/Rec2 [Deltaproteobacteria bacterium]|nr:DNA internalization-related competence protein ComEC/Rec2 [Deltaproteobacteria bacterium]